MNGQIDLELGAELKQLAINVAKETNLTSEEAFDYILEAIRCDAEWRKRALEISVRTASMDFDEIYQNYADTIGIEELSKNQKMSALIIHILHEER